MWKLKNKLNLQIFTVGSIFRYQCTSWNVFNLKFQSYLTAVLLEMLNNKAAFGNSNLKNNHTFCNLPAVSLPVAIHLPINLFYALLFDTKIVIMKATNPWSSKALFREGCCIDVMVHVNRQNKAYSNYTYSSNYWSNTNQLLRGLLEKCQGKKKKESVLLGCCYVG